MTETQRTIYPDGTFTQSCIKSLGLTASERAADYDKFSLIAFENEEFKKSDIYAEWARLERLK